MNEQVLVFEEGEMEGFKDLPGISINKEDFDYFITKVLPTADFMDREKAEQNPSCKQIIPYQIIRQKGKILCYKRTKASGEPRLREKWSVGIGGHVNHEDALNTDQTFEILSNGTQRELTEELEWGDTILEPITFGLIYDTSNDVGKVHFGVVIVIEILDKKEDLPKLKEDALAELAWLEPKEALELPNLENWSRMVLEKL